MVSLISTVMYCILEPLAVSINPLNDHWALRDYAARLLSQVLRYVYALGQKKILLFLVSQPTLI